MTTTVEKLRTVLTEKNISITKVVRFVHILQKSNGEILIINKKSHIGSLGSYNCYLGWQICSECSWGSDLMSEDVIELEKNVIEEKTGLVFQKENISIVDVFCCEKKFENYLNIVLLFNVKDESTFSYWHEWDTNAEWLTSKNAELKINFVEDKLILSKLMAGGYHSSLI